MHQTTINPEQAMINEANLTFDGLDTQGLVQLRLLMTYSQDQRSYCSRARVFPDIEDLFTDADGTRMHPEIEQALDTVVCARIG